jgi:hypothetical protein
MPGCQEGVVKLDLGSLWYEDDSRLESAPWRDPDLALPSLPRETGRIVSVTKVDEDRGVVTIANVGGRWVGRKSLGTKTVASASRFGRAGGYRPLPQKFFSAIEIMVMPDMD